MTDRPIGSGAQKRSTWLYLIMFAVFAFLLIRIFIIQTVNFEKYQNKVIDQMTTESAVAASRGKIYDRNGSPLATNVTTYRVFISPSAIQSYQNELPEDTDIDYATLISTGLSEILGVKYDEVYKQATKYTKYLDRTIKRVVYEEKADEVREFIGQHDLEKMIYLEAQSTRYYPNDSLGCHMIGFTSSDGVGLYGLELEYDKYLKGTDGYYIMARDSYGNLMPFDYASYIDAVDGYDLTTTIDTTVQNFLEEQIEMTVTDHDAQNRACGIVMDVNTGAILAMATSSPFDLNDPWGLDPASKNELKYSGYAEGSDEYNELSRDLLTKMWSNKAVTESYIPGSTFKIITTSMALEEKVLSVTDGLTCSGSKVVSGIRVHCYKTEGHGPLTFTEGLQHSCNVWFMTAGEKIGKEKFAEYFSAYGYTEKTGIDLPGEGNSIYRSEMDDLDLAIYSFGQNFNVTPMQQICAVSAVANGGDLVTPYIVERITDKSGNVIFSHETEVRRQVVSEEICNTISSMLEEGVSGDGGAKNAYVAGYRVAAKTGTSEKKDAGKEGMYICSTVAYAPADDPQIAIIIIVDEPTEGVLYGSSVAAPYVSGALKNIMPYLGIEAKYTEKELEKMAVKVGRYTGMSLENAKEAILDRGLKYTVVGSGEVVKKQLPEYGSYIEKVSGNIVLYMGNAELTNDVTVPNMTGMTAAAANGTLVNLGLNIKIEGTNNYLSGTGARVYSQSVPAGTKVAKGTVVTVTFRYTDEDDETDYIR